MRYLFFLMLPFLVFSQTESSDNGLSFSGYINLIKAEHPIVKQANLKIDEGVAKLLKARGGFDPKVNGDFNTKEFKDKTYYDQFNAKLKVPTWFGVELQAGFEDNSGVFLNLENNVPNNGLFNAGVSASLGQGLLINKRMADLKKARAYQNQTIAERELLVNQILYEASLTYFNWNKAYQNLKVYEDFLDNAKFRFNGIKRQVVVGEKAPVDSLEALITVDNRKLELEQAKIELNKARLSVSNYLWLNNVPQEINSVITPIEVLDDVFNKILAITNEELSHIPKFKL